MPQSLETEPPPDIAWYRSCRILLTFITAWGYVFFYLLRIDLSLAIVCMVRDPDTSRDPHDNTPYSENRSATSVRVRPLYTASDIILISYSVCYVMMYL